MSNCTFVLSILIKVHSYQAKRALEWKRTGRIPGDRSHTRWVDQTGPAVRKEGDKDTTGKR